MKVRKAVVLAAGFGTRFLPATKAQPKEMLPIIDKPVIQYVVEEVIQAGIKDIILVTGRGKHNIENHFDRSPDLELHLLKKDDQEKLAQVEKISKMADVFYVRQKEQKGLPDAIYCARDHINDEPFAVLYGDDFFTGKNPLKELLDVYDKYHSSVVGVTEVPRKEVYRYGVIKGREIEPSVYEMDDVVEKPKVEEAPSNLVNNGRLVLTPEYFEAIEQAPFVKGEKWWPDAARILMKKQKFYAKRMDAKWHAVGDKTNYVKTTIEFALKRDDMKNDVKAYLQELAKKNFVLD